MKRQRTRKEWEADRRFNRRLGWAVATVTIAAVAGIIWIAVVESTESVGVVDPFPTERVWSSR